MAEDTRERLIEIAKAFEEDLENLETMKDVEKFLEESVYDIRRIQSGGPNGWETLDYELLVAGGGPTVWIRTDGIIEAYWSTEKIEYPVSERAKKGLDMIYDYLSEIEG